MKRAIILIDGQNLFYNLKYIGIQERDIVWDKFFLSFMTPEDELIRTYWFRPQRLLDGYFTPQNLRNQICYKKHNAYIQDYNNNRPAIPSNILKEIDDEAVYIENWLQKEKTKFASIEYNYDQISLEYGI